MNMFVSQEAAKNMSYNNPLNSTTTSPTSSMSAIDDSSPTPRINLNNLDGVRREMSRVYRNMREGSIATQDGTRLVYVLGELRKMFEICELEKRLERLEGHSQVLESHEP